MHSGAVCFNYFAQDFAVDEFERGNEPTKGLPQVPMALNPSGHLERLRISDQRERTLWMERC